MNKRTMAVLLCSFGLGWWWLGGEEAPEVPANDAKSEVVSRLWIDHIPTSEREPVEVFAMLEEDNLGGFVRSSAYEGDFAAFQWRLEKGLVLHMLQKKTDHKVEVVIEKGRGCAPFDRCMRIIGAPRGAKRYGTMEEWVIESSKQLSPQAISGFIESVRTL